MPRQREPDREKYHNAIVLEDGGELRLLRLRTPRTWVALRCSSGQLLAQGSCQQCLPDGESNVKGRLPAVDATFGTGKITGRVRSVQASQGFPVGVIVMISPASSGGLHGTCVRLSAADWLGLVTGENVPAIDGAFIKAESKRLVPSSKGEQAIISLLRGTELSADAEALERMLLLAAALCTKEFLADSQLAYVTGGEPEGMNAAELRIMLAIVLDTLLVGVDIDDVELFAVEPDALPTDRVLALQRGLETITGRPQGLSASPPSPRRIALPPSTRLAFGITSSLPPPLSALAVEEVSATALSRFAKAKVPCADSSSRAALAVLYKIGSNKIFEAVRVALGAIEAFPAHVDGVMDVNAALGLGVRGHAGARAKTLST